jgi:hypothetical protein
MQNSFLFDSPGSTLDARAPATNHGKKRNLPAMTSNDDSPTPFEDPSPGYNEKTHSYDTIESGHRMAKKAQLSIAIDMPVERTSTKVNVLPSPLSDNEASISVSPYATSQKPCISTDMRYERKYSYNAIVELLASEMMIMKDGVYWSIQEKLKGKLQSVAIANPSLAMLTTCL